MELVFLQAPTAATPEDQLLVQFQGMIAEYERAQIAERCRRGKRHKAHQGLVNVLSGAPYGYRYVRKSDSAAAYYEVVDAEAQVVRTVFEAYTQQGLSINAIARRLNDRQIPTRTASARWERSTVWGLLRNPAYQGRACYGKTELRPRQRITRPLRQRQALPSRTSANHERPRPEWIEIPVPPLVSAETFALAQEQLEQNKRHAPRRTMEPTLLQGMLVCQQCGYALYRTSTRTTKRKLNYYRCLGADGYRRLQGPVCTNRPIRQDQLDAFVWTEILRLLEEPGLIQAEIDRRRDVARTADPLRNRAEQLRREQARLEKSIERLLTAYQEGLVKLPELRHRMPEVRKQAQAVESELHSLQMAAVDDAKYLQLAESLATFRSKLRARAETLDVRERQQVLRLLVKEVLIGGDSITIRHSIPVPPSGSGSNGTPAPVSGPAGAPDPGYLLRSRRHFPAAREPLPPRLRYGVASTRAGAPLAGPAHPGRRGLRDPLPLAGGASAGDRCGAPPGPGSHAEREEDPGPGCAAGGLHLPRVHGTRGTESADRAGGPAGPTLGPGVPTPPGRREGPHDPHALGAPDGRRDHGDQPGCARLGRLLPRPALRPRLQRPPAVRQSASPPLPPAQAPGPVVGLPSLPRPGPLRATRALQAAWCAGGGSSCVCLAVKVLGEPDAGEPHVRFAEGVLGFAHGRAREAPPDERGGNR